MLNKTRGSAGDRRIVFLAFQKTVLLDLTGPWEVFALANSLSAQKCPPYALELVSGDDDDIIDSRDGIAMQSHYSANECQGEIDTLIVPAAELPSTPSDEIRVTQVLQRLAESSRRIVSICGGAYYLAQAGYLDGRKATTHWYSTTDFSTRFPKVDVQADALFVKDENVYTSAGVTAGIDLALALVEEDLGQTIAMDCARHLVVFMRRPGGQSQFSATLASQQSEQQAITELIVWATDNPGADLSVEAMARRVHMSPRNFSRVFRNDVGQTPAAFIERLRVDTARRYLECSNDSIDVISTHCGFGSADSMRRSFRRIVKVAPNDYRLRFRSI